MRLRLNTILSLAADLMADYKISFAAEASAKLDFLNAF
jgi:hypothetical protein